MAFCYGDSVVGTTGINGDAFFISSDNTTIMLADGASGAGEKGKVIMSSHCVKTLEQEPFSGSGLSPEEYLDTIIWKINDDLIKISQKSKTYTFGTLIICVVHNHIVNIASIGDSPAYVIHNGSIRRVSKSIKTYQNLIDMDLLTEDQAEEYIRKLHPYMYSMFDRFIPMVVPEYSIEKVELTSGDVIVLCCDGVSDFISPDEIKDIISTNAVSEGISKIIEIAKYRSIKEHGCEKYDDITVVTYCH